MSEKKFQPKSSAVEIVIHTLTSTQVMRAIMDAVSDESGNVFNDDTDVTILPSGGAMITTIYK